MTLGASTKERSSQWLGVRRLLVGHRSAVAGIALVSVVGAGLEAVLLVVIARTAFAVSKERDRFGVVAGLEFTMTAVALACAAIVIARIGFAVLGAWMQARLTSSIMARFREDLAAAYLRASWSTKHGERTGRLQELLTSFIGQGVALVWSLAQAIITGSSLAVLLAIAVAVDPGSALVVIVAVGLLGSVLRPLRAAVKRQAHFSSLASMEFATSLSEISQLGMEMHVFNVQRQTETRLGKLIQTDESAGRRLGLLRGLVPAVYSGVAFAAIVGALFFVSTVDSVSLNSVSVVILVMLRSLSYGQSMQSAVTTINASLPFVNTIDVELNRYRAAGVVDHGEPIGAIGVLELRDASFEYVAGVPVLRGVSATIGPREVIGVVGPSGSGKSTLVQLLLGLREPTDGTITADGRLIGNLSRTEWARKVTFVPQAAHLIAGTVADNIRFLREDISQDDVERASRQAQLHQDVEAWEAGYQREVGEQGSHLSGGQQQRLIIARALVEAPDLLILDEPTSALDVRSESLIRATLDELRSEMSIIVIAHRLSTLAICDRIMVIQDGELKAFDTPENLERDNDFYREALILSGLR